jgi:flagellar L-ring protein precursor FlgH
VIRRLDIPVTLGFMALLAGCAGGPSSARPPLVQGDTSVRPAVPVPLVASRGSLVPLQTYQAGAKGLFEERRAIRVGDTLTVVLNETTRASKDGGTKTNRQSNNTSEVGLRMSNTGQNSASRSDMRVGASVGGTTGFDAKAGTSASNQFSGTITVTVLEQLPNGNLKVAGEKRLAVGAEEEIIRFAGVVFPQNIQGSTVLSSQVADARIEYRGAGITDEVQRPGWLTRLFIRHAPN